jgi:hypothetical protein
MVARPGWVIDLGHGAGKEGGRERHFATTTRSRPPVLAS